jgi:hypothetical protein
MSNLRHLLRPRGDEPRPEDEGGAVYDYNRTDYEAREWTRRRRRAAEAERSVLQGRQASTAAPASQGIQVSSPLPTDRRWRALSSDSRTGATSDQCLPTGHRWSRTQPRRSPLNDTLGIQSVRNR